MTINKKHKNSIKKRSIGPTTDAGGTAKVTNATKSADDIGLVKELKATAGELWSRKSVKLGCCVLIAIVTALIVLGTISNSNETEVKYEDYEVSTAEMKKTLTAAGEVTTAEAENISFSTSKVFRAMCVEENEIVEEGERLIQYSDGSYETAPSDGVIVSINAPQTGTTASSNNLIEFGKIDVLSLEVTVPEDQISDIEEGDKASIVVNSDTSKTYSGKIVELKEMSTTLLSEKSSSSSASGSNSLGEGGQAGDVKADPFGSESSTAYYTVVIEFKNDGSIKPGMSANSTITISEREDVLVVPVEAVYFDEDDKPYVQMVKTSSTENVEVEIGDSDAENVEIVSGLEKGDIIKVGVLK